MDWKGVNEWSMGTVFDLSWDPGLDPLSMDPLQSFPTVLLIRFDDYSGPDFPGLLPGVIPVFPATHSYDYKGISCFIGFHLSWISGMHIWVIDFVVSTTLDYSSKK
jgi:hypothetical protein